MKCFNLFLLSGKWLPEEERLLAQAVYDLSGCEPGMFILTEINL